MEGKRMDSRFRLRILAGVMLLLGLFGTIALYQGEAGQPGTVAEETEGLDSPLGPADFKKSAREMEVFGGKAMVMLERLRHRLVGLAQGNGPALLVAVGSLTVAGLLWIAASRPFSDVNAPGDDEDARRQDRS
jgi:hypothetical protein